MCVSSAQNENTNSCSSVSHPVPHERWHCRRDQKLPQFLDAYRQEAGLSVHWVLVGPSGRRTRPPGGGVLQHYTQCAGEGRHMVKTIANTFYLANVASHPHNLEFRCAAASRCR